MKNILLNKGVLKGLVAVCFVFALTPCYGYEFLPKGQMVYKGDFEQTHTKRDQNGDLCFRLEIETDIKGLEILQIPTEKTANGYAACLLPARRSVTLRAPGFIDKVWRFRKARPSQVSLGVYTAELGRAGSDPAAYQGGPVEGVFTGDWGDTSGLVEGKTYLRIHTDLPKSAVKKLLAPAAGEIRGEFSPFYVPVVSGTALKDAINLSLVNGLENAEFVFQDKKVYSLTIDWVAAQQSEQAKQELYQTLSGDR